MAYIVPYKFFKLPFPPSLFFLFLSLTSSHLPLLLLSLSFIFYPLLPFRHFLARDVIYTSRAYATMSVSVCMSVCLWRKCIVVTVHAGNTATAPASEVEAIIRSPTNMAAADVAAADFNKMTSKWRHSTGLLAAMFVEEDLLANRRLQTLLLFWLNVRSLESI